jgi:thioredoxin-dependent peroxiredoxin
VKIAKFQMKRYSFNVHNLMLRKIVVNVHNLLWEEFFMASVTFAGGPVTLVGNEVKVGDKAPNFTVLANDLSPVTLEDSKGSVRIISVVPSLDTGVCDAQTRRFNEEAAKLGDVKILTISVDLPFAQQRWCGAAGIDQVQTLSDHRDLSFGEAYGIAIQELRLLARGVFVVDSNDTVTYAEYVSEVTEHPNYEAAIEAAKQAK